MRLKFCLLTHFIINFNCDEFAKVSYLLLMINQLIKSNAERLNGIIKDEYLDTYDIDTIKEAKELLKAVVDLYYTERPYMSIGNLIPNHIHHSKTTIKTEKLWKNYYQKKPAFVNQEQD